MQLLSKLADQERLLAELREENARLKGLLNGRPRIKPSGMEDASEPKRSAKRGKHRRRGKIVPRVAIEDRVIKAQVPPGSTLQRLREFRGAGHRAACRGDTLPTGAMGHAGWNHRAGWLAGRRGRAFRTRAASFPCAGATPSRPGDGAAAGGSNCGGSASPSPSDR